jgi:hypothetical protein
VSPREHLSPEFAIPVQTGWYTTDFGATGGCRYQFAPVYQSGFKYFEFEFEKLKNETKIPKTTSRFIESNIVKFPNLVHLVFFYHYNISQNRKRTPAH